MWFILFDFSSKVAYIFIIFFKKNGIFTKYVKHGYNIFSIFLKGVMIITNKNTIKIYIWKMKQWMLLSFTSIPYQTIAFAFYKNLLAFYLDKPRIRKS